MAKKSSKRRRRIIGFLILFILLIYLNNSSYLAEPIRSGPVILAHRAMGQAYDREGLTGETCTAERMIPTGHSFLENTIPSIKAAFEQGADIVEFDVHRTTDDRFAVFHDWTLDCRTDGQGITHDHSLAELQALDIGYGYTADGGKTYPFRGKGCGMMPSMEEILTTFPDKDFMIDIKSGIASEGVLLAARLAVYQQSRTGKIMVYGGGRPVNEVRKRMPDLQTTTRPRLRRCLTRYALLGWTGYVPSDCEDCVLMVPANVAPWLWGWPNCFIRRMDRNNSQVMLLGNYGGEGFSTPYDDLDHARQLPASYSGGIWTDRIELMAPLFEEK